MLNIGRVTKPMGKINGDTSVRSNSSKDINIVNQS